MHEPIRLLAVTLLSTASLFAPSSSSAKITILDFDNAKDGRKFDPVSGRWRVDDDAYIVKDSGDKAISFFDDDDRIEDVEATIQWRVVGSPAGATVLIRSQYDRDLLVQGYEFGIVNYGDSAEFIAGRFRFDENGVIFCRSSMKTSIINKWHEVKISVKGSNFSVILNKKKICSFNDGNYKFGLFGFAATGPKGTSLEIDKLTINTADTKR